MPADHRLAALLEQAHDLIRSADQLSGKCQPGALDGLRTLLRKWTRQGLCDTRALVCLEPTGHYSHGVVKTLVDMRYPTWLAHATDIRFSLGMQRGTSDTVAAPRIAPSAHPVRAHAPQGWLAYSVLQHPLTPPPRSYR